MTFQHEEEKEPFLPFYNLFNYFASRQKVSNGQLQNVLYIIKPEWGGGRNKAEIFTVLKPYLKMSLLSWVERKARQLGMRKHRTDKHSASMYIIGGFLSLENGVVLEHVLGVMKLTRCYIRLQSVDAGTGCVKYVC